MSMLGDEIAAYIAGRGVGEYEDAETRDIWLERLPQGTVSGIVLASEPGLEPHRYLDTLMDGLTFYARYKDGTEAYDKLAQIRDILHRAANYDTPNMHIYFSHAAAGIAYVDTDLNSGMIYSLSINFIYQKNSLIS